MFLSSAGRLPASPNRFDRRRRHSLIVAAIAAIAIFNLGSSSVTTPQITLSESP